MSKPDFQLSAEVGASFERDEGVTFYDIRGHSAVRTITLTGIEVNELVTLWMDEYRPACPCEVCDACKAKIAT